MATLRDPIDSLLTARGRHDLDFLNGVANQGLQPGERTSSAVYLRDLVDETLRVRAEEVRRVVRVQVVTGGKLHAVR